MRPFFLFDIDINEASFSVALIEDDNCLWQQKTPHRAGFLYH
jgi:hypothetical protein